MLINPLITTYLKVRQNCRRGTLSTRILPCIDVMTQFRRDFGGPDTEVKPFENQMNNEHGTSAISLHDFYEIEARRLRGFLNVEEKENSVGGRTLG
jgi:hypothetical protein